MLSNFHINFSFLLRPHGVYDYLYLHDLVTAAGAKKDTYPVHCSTSYCLNEKGELENCK